MQRSKGRPLFRTLTIVGTAIFNYFSVVLLVNLRIGRCIFHSQTGPVFGEMQVPQRREVPCTNPIRGQLSNTSPVEVVIFVWLESCSDSCQCMTLHIFIAFLKSNLATDASKRLGVGPCKRLAPMGLQEHLCRNHPSQSISGFNCQAGEHYRTVVGVKIQRHPLLDS